MELEFRHRLPTVAGWWARFRSGNVDWFDVDLVDNGSLLEQLVVWNSDTEEFVPVHKYSSPLTRWAGPITFHSVVQYGPPREPNAP